MSLTCEVIFQTEPEGGYTVIVPSLPGCITYGVDLEEAQGNAKEAVELYNESLEAHGEAVNYKL